MTNLIQKYLAYLIFPVTACVLSLVLTRICISILPVFGLMDEPDERRIHKKVTPKGGGVAIILAFAVTCFCFSISPWNYYIGDMTLGFLKKISIPAVLLIVVGLLDDRFNLRARYKLVGQIIVGVLCWYLGVGFSNVYGVILHPFISCVVSTIWIVGFINAFNLIDGMDGLAAGLGIVSCACMAVFFIFEHAPLNVVIILSLAGACLGFLRYNFHPARVFMGDTGSMFLGFMMAVVGIVSTTKLAAFSAVAVPILAAGVPVFDVFLAIWRRVSRKLLRKQEGDNGKNDKIMTADTEHLHHRILEKSNNSQAKTTLIIYGVSVLFAMAALSLVIFKDQTKGLAFLIALGTFVAAIRYLATIELWNSAKVFVHGIHRPRRGALVTLAHPFFDALMLCASFLTSYYLFNEFIWNDDKIPKVLLSMSYSILPVLILLHIGRAYKRFWFRASSNDYIKLFELLFFGHMLNIAIQYFRSSEHIDLKVFVAQILIFFLLSSFLIIGERMALRYLKSNLMGKLYVNHKPNVKYTRVLLYGGGMRCRFFINEISHKMEDNPVTIVGIIDDALPLRGQYVYGQKVLGSSKDLDEIQQKTKFEKIIVTSKRIGDEGRDLVKNYCAEHELKVTEVIFKEKEIQNAQTDICDNERI